MLDIIKKFKDKYESMSKVFYNISLKHKNSRESDVQEYVGKEHIKNTIKTLKTNINTKIKEKRQALKKLKKKTKSGRITLANGNTIEYSYKLTEGIHHSKNVFLTLKNKHLLDAFFKSKKPETDEHYIGVEIECYIKGSHKNLAQALMSEDNELSKKVTIKADGSLRRQEGEINTELAIIDTEENIHETLKSIEKVLEDFEIRVDDSCGLHVHLDMRNKIAELCFHNLVKMQTIFYKMQPKERETNQYCRKTESSNVFKMLRQGERYRGINPCSLENLQTIEIRLHEGTYKAEEINNWINLLLRICSIETKIVKSYRSIKSICKKFGFKAEVESYVESRIKTYEVAS